MLRPFANPNNPKAHYETMEEGLMCGISSGSAVTASLKVSNSAEMKGNKIVVIIPPFAERYLTSEILDQQRAESYEMKAESERCVFILLGEHVIDR